MTPDDIAFVLISVFLAGVGFGAHLVAAVSVARRPPGGRQKLPPNPPIL